MAQPQRVDEENNDDSDSESESDEDNTFFIDSSQQWTISVHYPSNSASSDPLYQALAASNQEDHLCNAINWGDKANKFSFVAPDGAYGYYAIINTAIDKWPGKALTTNKSTPPSDGDHSSFNNLEWCDLDITDDHQLWKLIDINGAGSGLVKIQNKAFEDVSDEYVHVPGVQLCGGLLCWTESSPHAHAGHAYVIGTGDTDAKSTDKDLGWRIEFNLAVFENPLIVIHHKAYIVIHHKALIDGVMEFDLDLAEKQVLEAIYQSTTEQEPYAWCADVIIENKLSFIQDDSETEVKIPNGTIFQCGLPFISSCKNNQYTFQRGATDSRYWGQTITQQFEATYKPAIATRVHAKIRRCYLTIPYTLTFSQLPDVMIDNKHQLQTVETTGNLTGIFYYGLSCEPEYYGNFTSQWNGDTMIVNDNGMTIHSAELGPDTQCCPASIVSYTFTYSWPWSTDLQMHYDSITNEWVEDGAAGAHWKRIPASAYYGNFTHQGNGAKMIVNDNGMTIHYRKGVDRVVNCPASIVSYRFIYSWPWGADLQMHYDIHDSSPNEWVDDSGGNCHWPRDAPGPEIIINAIKNIKDKDKENVEVKDDEKLDFKPNEEKEEFIPYPVFKRPKDDNDDNDDKNDDNDDISVSDLIKAGQGRNYTLEKQNNDLYLQLEYRKEKGDPWIFASFPLGYIVRKTKNGTFKQIKKVNTNKPYRWKTKKPKKKIKKYTIKENGNNEGRITASLKKHGGWKNGQTYDVKSQLCVVTNKVGNVKLQCNGTTIN